MCDYTETEPQFAKYYTHRFNITQNEKKQVLQED